jgi:branched-chain amino acid transport system substrate-binding protein
MRRAFLVRLSAAAVAVASAGLFNVTAAFSQEPIRIGIVLPLSGQNGEYVKRYLIAPTEMAAKEANDKGGILGRQVKIVVEDSRYDPASAVSAAKKLADVDKVIAVFTGFTPLTLPQLPVAEEKRFLVIAPSTEHPDLTKSPWAVRMTPTADKAGIRIAALAKELGMKTAAVLSEDNESVRLTERAFRSEFEKTGGKIVGVESFKTQDTDMRGQLTKLRAAKPDALYLTMSAGRPMALVLKQISEVGLRPKQIFANHLIEDKEVRSIGGNMSEGVIYTTLRVAPAFSERFKALYGYDADANAGKHYDATVLLFDAIKRAGTADDAGKVRDAIYKYGEFNGVLGTFLFQGTGEPGISPALKMVKGGSYVDYQK